MIWRSEQALATRRDGEAFHHRPLVARLRCVVVELASELVGVIEDLLDGARHRHHLTNLGRAGMA
jgi:hypothetical protein